VSPEGFEPSTPRLKVSAFTDAVMRVAQRCRRTETPYWASNDVPGAGLIAATDTGMGLLRWTRRLVRSGPYVAQTSNAYELTPAGTATPLPSGGTRIGDGQKGRQTGFVDITYCPPSNEVREAQAALARARAVMETRMLENGCRMVPAL
jgi:hypothetical protein